jgi:hypothetical protein
MEVEVLTGTAQRPSLLLLQIDGEVIAGGNDQYIALSPANARNKNNIVKILEKAGAIEGKDMKDKPVNTFQIK